MKHPLLLFIILLYACEGETGRRISFEFERPKVVEAKEYKIHPDKVSPPIVVRASNPGKTILGKPEIVQLPSNVFPAKISASTPAGLPKVALPGGAEYESPRVIPSVDSPYEAGLPK